MPELPEVETLRRGLEAAVVGRRVCSVALFGERTVRRQDPAQLVAALSGRLVSGAARWGKYLVVPLGGGAGDEGGEALVVHLRMSGQLLHVGAGAPLAHHTRALIGLDDGSELRFVDPRTFGELFVADALEASGRPSALAALGPDPLVDGIDADRLAALAKRRRCALKTLLLDQKVLAGIGNIYADEILFRAGLRPARAACSLAPVEHGRLVAAIGEVLAAAVAARGSTLSDARYLDLGGAPGSYQEHHAVYARTGAPCLGCGTPVTRVRVAGRSAHFCRSCQA